MLANETSDSTVQGTAAVVEDDGSSDVDPSDVDPSDVPVASTLVDAAVVVDPLVVVVPLEVPCVDVGGFEVAPVVADVDCVAVSADVCV